MNGGQTSFPRLSNLGTQLEISILNHLNAAAILKDSEFDCQEIGKGFRIGKSEYGLKMISEINGRAGGLLARIGSLNGHPPYQQTRLTLLDSVTDLGDLEVEIAKPAIEGSVLCIHQYYTRHVSDFALPRHHLSMYSKKTIIHWSKTFQPATRGPEEHPTPEAEETPNQLTAEESLLLSGRTPEENTTRPRRNFKIIK
ncbi:hypothetical protein J6590_027389 [Homalodisca vitripennis]|nr:hypothetical protein J6590_027386 [Homalodisca vitripennis]KAG8278134.1 hypothetical protein J6590_027389 [Homalodisca vitripennis]